jgi:beta-lactamase class A
VRQVALVATLVGTVLVTGSRADGPRLQALLTDAAQHFPGILTLYVKHLKTGETAAVDGSRPMDSMSVIKLGILVKAYQMAERHQLRLDDRIALKSEDRRGGSGVLQFHASGLKPTIRDLLMEMVITSDNTATDLALARVGGVAALNSWFEQAGFPQLHMNGSIAAYFRRYMGSVDPAVLALSDADVYTVMMGAPLGRTIAPSLQRIKGRLDALPATAWDEGLRPFSRDPHQWLGTITADAIGGFLERIETGQFVSPTLSKEMTRIMSWQKSGERRIGHYIDTQYVIAHKTGDSPPFVANDVGIVYLDSGATVVVMLANDIQGNYGEAEDREGELARSIAEYFDKSSSK